MSKISADEYFLCDGYILDGWTAGLLNIYVKRTNMGSMGFDKELHFRIRM